MKHKRNYLGMFSFVLLTLFLLSACEKEDITPPGQVTDLAVSADKGEVVLTWTEPTDADLDRIEVSYSPGSDMVYSQASGLNGITITGLTNGTSYEFAVVTVDETGNKSDAVLITALPNSPFVVVSPDQNDYNQYGGTFTTDGSGHLIISVTFNRPVDQNSVVPAQTIYFEGDAISQGTVAFSNNDKTLTFTTTDIVSDFVSFSPDGHFSFLLVGDDADNGVIMDHNGMPLDGDENGANGGNYVLNFTIIG
ncbi:MAG: DUF4959 domain-containing protein [Bacteroidota bacterium]